MRPLLLTAKYDKKKARVWGTSCHFPYDLQYLLLYLPPFHWTKWGHSLVKQACIVLISKMFSKDTSSALYMSSVPDRCVDDPSPLLCHNQTILTVMSLLLPIWISFSLICSNQTIRNAIGYMPNKVLSLLLLLLLLLFLITLYFTIPLSKTWNCHKNDMTHCINVCVSAPVRRTGLSQHGRALSERPSSV